MRVTCLFLLTMALLTNNCWANDRLSPDEQRLKAAMLQYSKHVSDMLRTEIKNHLPMHGKQSLAGYKRRLSILRKHPYQMPLLYPWDLKTGHLGRMSGGLSATTSPRKYNRFHILQIIDNRNILMNSPDGGYFTHETGCSHRRSKERLFMLTDINTANMIDDVYMPLDGIFEVLGTKRYDAHIGSNTIPVISPFPLQFPTPESEKDLLRKFKKAEIAAKKKKRKKL